MSRLRKITIGEVFALKLEKIEAEQSRYPVPSLGWTSETLNLFGSALPMLSTTADVIGKLAVHRLWLPKKQGWSNSRYSITHLPTKRQVCRGLGWERSMELAEKLAPLDWDFDELPMPPKTQEQGPVIVHCFRWGIHRRKRTKPRA
jgi:hypothetical protein